MKTEASSLLPVHADTAVQDDSRSRRLRDATQVGERHWLVTILFVVFFLASLAMGLKVLPVVDEDFSDIMYFFVVTLSTVGYGDVVVKSEASMVFIIVWSFAGLLLAAAIVGIVSVQSMHRREQQRAKADAQLDDKQLGLFVPKQPGTLPQQAKIWSIRNNIRAWFREQHTVLRVFYSSTPYLLFVVLGSFAIGWIESWSAVEALYFGFTTATTIGFGDVVPKDYNGKWLCVLYIPVSVILMARFFNEVADMFVQAEIEAVDQIRLAKRFDANQMMHDLCTQPKHACVSELEFTRYMLKAMGKVDERVLAAIHQQFNKLDPLQSGVLDYQALKELEEQSSNCDKSSAWASSRWAEHANGLAALC